MASPRNRPANSALPSRRKPAATFAANARIKALAAARATGKPAFADDSGLVVDALGGEPGIHSARWAGPDKDFRSAMNKIQTLLIERGAKTPEQRRAHFVAALCLAWPDGHVEDFEGRVDGIVVWPPRGDKGFGYDPLFKPDGFDRTFGEMSAEEKHGLPPRGNGPVASRARFRETRRGVLANMTVIPGPAEGRNRNAETTIITILTTCPRQNRIRAGRCTSPRPMMLNMTLTAQTPFAVYVHWPFCLSKCPYCDFNSHVRHGGIDEARFLRAFEAELAATAQRVPGRTVSTIFFGGGTPSLMQPQTVQAILDAIAKHWSVAPDVEVTLEANPTSVEATRFRGYRTAGVNRVSLGVQSLDDAALKELGRLHTAQEALDAVAVARAIFDRYSFDLIYARPRQTLEAWGAELKRAIAEAAEHLSLYQLTIEPDTPFFGLHKAGKLAHPRRRPRRAISTISRR